jgi:hypothetical protein
MNSLVYEYLNKTGNNPHKAYDEYIKYHLLSGKSLPEDIKGIKDFITASKPEQTKQRKTYIKKSAEPTEPKMSITEVIDYLKQIIKLEEEQLEMDKKSKLFKDSAKTTWSSLQENKILLCKILGKEYICTDYPN